MRRFAIAVLTALLILPLFGCSREPRDIYMDQKPFSGDVSVHTDSGVYEGGFGYESLDQSGKKLYELIGSAAEKPNSSGEVYYGDASDIPLGRVLKAYLGDHPEAFWLGTGIEASQYTDYCVINLSFYFDGDELKRRKTEFESAVQRALDGAPETQSAYEKEIYVNDYLADNCAYNYEAAESDNHKTAHTAYGALVEGSAVCDGYSAAFQLLCEKLGVTCVTVDGSARDIMTGSDGAHMWNAVRIDGDWYYTDVTWNDAEESKLPSARYCYFNITGAQAEEDREIYPEYSDKSTAGERRNAFVPECDSDEYNWLRRSLPVLKSPDDGFSGDIADAAKQGKAYFEFTLDSGLDYTDAFKRLTDGGIIGERILEANEINGSNPELDTACTVYSYPKRRIVGIELKRI